MSNFPSGSRISSVLVAEVVESPLSDLLRAIPDRSSSPPSPVGLYAWFIKPAIDRICAFLLLVALSPVLLVVLLAVRRTLGKPALYRQERVGRGGRVFVIYKVRTMRHDRRRERGAYDGPERRQTHKSSDDPRHTPLGRWLRRSSIDELPQLWNVVRGDMSLIGPRPELVSVVARESLWLHPRHLVKPGITGLWQISPARGGEIRLGLDLDVAYVHHVGMRTDVRIALSTLSAVFRNPGQ